MRARSTTLDNSSILIDLAISFEPEPQFAEAGVVGGEEPLKLTVSIGVAAAEESVIPSAEGRG